MPNAVVTGANRGIGLELVRQLRQRYDVVATARRREEAKALRDLGARVERLDVSDESSVRAFADRLDGHPLDLLVNNAGVLLDDGKTPAVLDAEDVLATMRTNVVGPLLVTRALLGNLRLRDRRMVVQISSDAASIDAARRSNACNMPAYCMSKSALNMFNALLANELRGEGFTCVALHPGWVKTDMGGNEAHLTPEESVRGLVSRIDSLTPEDSGRYLNWRGEEMKW